MFIIITAIKNEIPINDDTLSCIPWKIWTKWMRTHYRLLIETEVQHVEKKKKKKKSHLSVLSYKLLFIYFFYQMPFGCFLNEKPHLKEGYVLLLR